MTVVTGWLEWGDGLQPAALTAGVRVWSRRVTGRSRPAWRSADGSRDLGSSPRSVARQEIHPGATTGLTSLGCGTSTSGTAQARSIATTNALTAANRTGYVSSASVGSRAMVAQQTQRCRPGDLVSGQLAFGFDALFRFGVQANPAGMIGFAGLMSTNTPGATLGSGGIANHVGLWKETGDTQWSIKCRASGTTTSVALGSDFTVTTTDLLRLELFCPPGVGTSIWWRVAREGTSIEASGVLTTDLPTGNLGGVINLSNNNTASACAVDFVGMVVEVDI